MQMKWYSVRNPFGCTSAIFNDNGKIIVDLVNSAATDIICDAHNNSITDINKKNKKKGKKKK